MLLEVLHLWLRGAISDYPSCNSDCDPLGPDAKIAAVQQGGEA